MDSKATKKDCQPKKKENKRTTKEEKQKELLQTNKELIKVDTQLEKKQEEPKEQEETLTIEVCEKEIAENGNDEKVETDLFKFASVFGKTEKGLKDEFYAYQIRSLMERTGLPIERKTEKRITEEFEQAVNIGVGEILLTPCLFPTLIRAKECKPSSKSKVCVIVDYPLGESSFKARVADVKYCLKNGADKVSVVLGEPAVNFGHVGIERLRLNKLFKTSKGKLGVALNADFSEEQLVRAVKIIENSKVKHVMLIAKNKNSASIIQAIRLIKAMKEPKEIFVLCDIGDLEEFSAILMENPSVIYTSSAEKVYKALKEKFGL